MRRFTRLVGGFVIVLPLAAVVAAPVGASAGPVELEPHRAIYAIALADADPAAGIVAAEGDMLFELAESCEGWTIRQQARFEVYGPEGDAVQTDISFSSWEDRNGLEYGFTLQTRQDGFVIEDLRGSATLDANGGVATYARPETHTVDLPPDTVFSASHTRLLLEKAAAGERHVVRPLFLGQREDEPMVASAVIAGPLPERDAPDEWRDLLSAPAWRLHLAFYGPDDDATPDFEIQETLHASGVVADAVIVYEGFSLRYAIEELEALPSPDC